jgi:hypothetical protein
LTKKINPLAEAKKLSPLIRPFRTKAAVANVIVAKYADLFPYTVRPRSTPAVACSWTDPPSPTESDARPGCWVLCTPACWNASRPPPKLSADETTAPVLDPARDRTKRRIQLCAS